ncbi:MAG: hypothetical protein IPK27_10195 [Rhodanobacteraceae bacterium]|nr:hypothetical protein [Rhodanobacteraceae bacterium]
MNRTEGPGHMRAMFLLWGLLLGAACRAQTVLIDAQHHALGNPISAVYRLPAGASAAQPVPACLVVHGSGGLLRENTPGAACGPQVEATFSGVADHLTSLGVAALMPDSFSSRDPRFCEDNEDAYFQYVPAPFFNPGDGPPIRDALYDRRRIVIRVLDLLAAQEWLCARPEIDCTRTCLVGASNGGSAVFAYAAQELPRHLTEYLDTGVRRRFESASGHAERQLAFAHFPARTRDPATQALARAVPRFVQAVSPGCRLRDLVPAVRASQASFDPLRDLGDLYYPLAPTELNLEIGSTDSVPDDCYADGLRQGQANDFETLVSVLPSRYRPAVYPGEGHDLLADIGPALAERRRQWVLEHFFPRVFANGFE